MVGKDLTLRSSVLIEILTSILFYLFFRLGVRTSDNNYTSPMLAVHLYDRSQYKAKIDQNNRTITVDTNNQQQTYQGPQQSKKEEKATGEEDLIMLPVEDITLISAKSETKEGVQADAKSKTEYVYDTSENCCDRCCASLLDCCCAIVYSIVVVKLVTVVASFVERKVLLLLWLPRQHFSLVTIQIERKTMKKNIYRFLKRRKIVVLVVWIAFVVGVAERRN
jgi:hypothetical protein